MKRVKIHPEIEAPESRHGSIVIVQPDEDLIPLVEEETEFALGEQLEVEIPGADGSVWESVGTVVALDEEEGFSLLLMVKIDYGQATLVG